MNSGRNQKENRARWLTLKVLLDANRYALQANKKVYIAILVFMLMNSLNIYISLSFTEYVINAATYIINRQISFYQAVQTVSVYTVILLLFLVLSVLTTNLKNRLYLDVNHIFQKQLNAKLSHIEWEYYESHMTFAQIFEVRQHANQAILELLDSSFVLLSFVPNSIVFVFYLLKINLLVVPIYILLILVFNLKLAGQMFSKLQQYWKDIQPYAQKKNYYFKMSGDKVTHQEFRFLRLFDFATKRWEDCFNAEFHIKLKIFRKHEITLQTARFLFNIPYILMMIFIGFEIMQGKHEIGFLIMANSLLNQIIDTCLQTQNHLVKTHVNRGFVHTWKQVMEYHEMPALLPPTSNFITLSLHNVYYVYPQSTYNALDGLNLTVNKGQKIAIVGANGSGKTTFVNILCKLTQSFKGYVSGLSAINVSCVSQNFAQYQMTIKDNIAMGNAKKFFSDEEIWSLLQQVGLKDYVSSLPQGIYTQLGELDEGIELSKGQWQRMAIARLLTNQEANLWVLDEPTAYLDPISEIEIYDMIYRISGARTVLFISHRLGFAKRADEILVFQNGKIVEHGTHTSLMNLHGEYARMYASQQSWYI